jgi:PAS domain S-box-containing protein
MLIPPAQAGDVTASHQSTAPRAPSVAPASTSPRAEGACETADTSGSTRSGIVAGIIPDVPDHAMESFDLDGLWRTVFDLSPVPLSLVSPSGAQLAGNSAYLEFLGYSADELDQLNVQSSTLEDDRAWTRTYLERLATGAIDRYRTEKTFVRKDGTSVRAQLDVSPLVLDGRCVALLGALTPVEERVPMGEGMLRKLIENIHDTISLLDRDGRLLETTGRYRPIMGYPREFWETRSIFDLLVPADVERVLEMQREVVAKPGETVSAEFSVMNAANEVEDLEVHAVNLLDDPDIAGIVVTSRNITGHRRMLQDLRASRDDALAEAELRSRMLATVSHELRNPLHAVQGISELLAKSDLPEAERSLAGTINRQVRDLTRVVDDLLASSRMELDSVSLEMDAVDLRGLLVDVVAIAKTRASEGVEVSALIDTSIPSLIRTDPVRLRQVLSNLVGNAVKFTGAGRVRVLASVEGNDWLSIEVSDSGSGIPADELDTIFEPFRSATTAGRGAGAGLGLSIVRRIVTMLDGTVDVSSTVGVGSTFSVRMPLQIASEQAPPVAADSATPTRMSEVSTDVDLATAVGEEEGHAAHVGPPVLVIEDNVVNQQLARAQLKSMGYECRIEGSGEDGLAYLAGESGADVEVVLMDFHLPGIDGLETTRRIRAAETAGAAVAGGAVGSVNRHVAIIGVTASASLGDRTSCLQAGMDDYVPKPVSLADLSAAFERVSAVRAALRQWRATDRAQALIDTDTEISTGTTGSTGSTGPAVEGAPDHAQSRDGATAPSAVIDLAVLESLAEELGDRGIVVELIQTFLAELQARVEGIVAAGAAGDSDGVHRLVHTLTSSARLLGASSLANVCRAFELGTGAGEVVLDTARLVRDELSSWAGG